MESFIEMSDTRTLEYKVPKRFLENKPLTLAYIRDSVRSNAYVGDLFEALEFMLLQYDIVNNRLKQYTNPTEYKIVSDSRKFDVV